MHKNKRRSLIDYSCPPAGSLGGSSSFSASSAAFS